MELSFQEDSRSAIDVGGDKDRSLKKTAALIYEDEELERRFRRFQHRYVPWTHIPIYVVWFLVVALLEITDYQVLGQLTYVGILIALFLVVMLVFTVTQIVTGFADRSGKGTSIRLLNISDGLLVTSAIFTSVVEYSLLYFDNFPKKCSNIAFLYQDTSSGPVYLESNCFQWLPPFIQTMGLLLVLRRQRFAHIMLMNVAMFIHNLIFVVIGDGDAGQGWTWKTLIYTLGYLSFGCAVRYYLEKGDRSRFEVQVTLDDGREVLKQRSAELQDSVKTLIPPILIERSSALNMDRAADENSEAVVIAMGVEDFTFRSRSLLPTEVVAFLERTHTTFEEKCATVHLYRTRIVEDEIVAIGNLIGSSRKPTDSLVHAACIIAEQFARESDAGPIPLRAAIHVGSVKGTFYGTGKVRYDAEGEGVTTALEVLCLGKKAQVLLTEDAYHVVRDWVRVTDGPSLETKSTWVMDSHGDATNRTNASSSDARGENTPFVSGTTEKDGMLQFDNSGDQDAVNLHSIALLLNRVKADEKRTVSEKEQKPEEKKKKGKYAMKKVWLLFYEFENQETEDAFLQHHVSGKLNRASFTWTAFVWLQFVLLVLLLSDEHADFNGVLPTIVFFVSIVASFAAAFVAPRLASESMSGWRTLWSVLSLFVPLITTIAGALSRPAAVGNDPRPLMLAAALVRSACFFRARNQLIAIPVFGLLSQFQALFPGGHWDVSYLFSWFLIMYAVVIDRDTDLAERENFINGYRIQEGVKLLEAEQRIRTGLLRSTLPSSVYSMWASGALLPGKAFLHTVPETMLVVISRVAEGLPGVGHTSSLPPFNADAVARIEALVALFEPLLSVLRIIGNMALIAGPIAAEDPSIRLPEATMAEILVALTALSEEDDAFSTFVDVDSSSQVISHIGPPKFVLHGAMLWRAVAMHEAGAIGTGLNCTERVRSIVQQLSADGKLAVEELEMGPRKKVRGVGMVRLSRLAVVPPGAEGELEEYEEDDEDNY